MILLARNIEIFLFVQITLKNLNMVAVKKAETIFKNFDVSILDDHKLKFKKTEKKRSKYNVDIIKP